MRTIYAFYALGFLIFSGCDTASKYVQPDKNYFLRYFGGDGNQTAVDLIANSDGSFFILGNSQIRSSEPQVIYLAKADATGHLVWEKTIGNKAKSIVAARGFVLSYDQKNIAVVANLQAPNGDSDIWLLKFDLNGDTVKTATFEYSPTLPINDWANSVTAVSDNGYAIGGYTDGPVLSANKISFLQIRLDSDLLNLNWQQSYGNGDIKNIVTKIEESGLKKLTFNEFGSSNIQNPQTDLDFSIFGIDSAGAPTGTGKFLGSYNSANDDLLTNVTPIPLSSPRVYVLTGYSTAGGVSKLKLLKATETNILGKLAIFDANIDVSLGKNIIDNGTTNISPFAGAALLGDNSFAIVTNTTLNSSGLPINSNIRLLKLGTDLQPIPGDPIDVQFGGDGDDYAAAVAGLSGGRIAVLGTMTLGIDQTQTKIVLLKLNSKGKLID